MEDGDRRKRAFTREMLKRYSCLQMKLLCEDEAKREGRDDLMSRVPEPEIMSPEEMRDFMLNNRPVSNELQGGITKTFLKSCPSIKLDGSLLDIGCGTGELTIFMSLVFPQMSITGVDVSPDCVMEAKKLAAELNVANPPEFVCAHLPHEPVPAPRFDTVFSRSSMHHFARGDDFWKAVKRNVKPDGAVFVYDLRRPLTRQIAQLQVDAVLPPGYAPECHRGSYLKSFLAAYRPAEVRIHVEAIGLDGVNVKSVDTPHLLAWRDAKGKD
jgi:ubiquinone/menaquinone biosynthesis C-methylase UbiE